MPCESFSMLDGSNGIEKLLLTTQVSEKFLHSEVNLIIQYIIVQDEYGQNNNTLNYARLPWRITC